MTAEIQRKGGEKASGQGFLKLFSGLSMTMLTFLGTFYHNLAFFLKTTQNKI